MLGVQLLYAMTFQDVDNHISSQFPTICYSKQQPSLSVLLYIQTDWLLSLRFIYLYYAIVNVNIFFLSTLSANKLTEHPLDGVAVNGTKSTELSHPFCFCFRIRQKTCPAFLSEATQPHGKPTSEFQVNHIAHSHTNTPVHSINVSLFSMSSFYVYISFLISSFEPCYSLYKYINFLQPLNFFLLIIHNFPVTVLKQPHPLQGNTFPKQAKMFDNLHSCGIKFSIIVV